MLVIGIALGFAAALSQSVSYIFSRVFVVKRHRGPVRLLVVAHVIMGVVSAALIPVVWTADMPPVAVYFWPLMAVSGFYMLGQAALFAVLRGTDASRAAPLLGLKIVILAAITAVFLAQPLGVMQWAGVLLGVVAAFVLNYSGGSLPWRALGGILLACTAYSLSDLNIKVLVDRLTADGVGQITAILLSVFMSYTVCGLAALALLPVVGARALEDWKYALPFAGAWFAGMICLFACFATIGVVLGNIIQSARGLFSVVIGAHVAALGKEHLETKVATGVLVRRLAAAVMMSAAIVLYVIGRGGGG